MIDILGRVGVTLRLYPFSLWTMTTLLMIMIIINASQYAIGANSDMEILVPPEHISTNSDHLFIVGKTDAPVVEIILNKQKYDEVIVKDSIFHGIVKFGYGLNEIDIKPVYNNISANQDQIQTVEILYGPNVESKYDKIFTEYIFHYTEPKSVCLQCHIYDNTNSETINIDQPCFDCHNNMLDRFKTHIPNDNRACVNCHHIKPDLTIAKTGNYNDTNLCYFCHKDKIGEFTKDYVHGPVAGGSCTICHNPHGSKFEKNLNNDVEILCGSCHAIVDEIENKTYSHKPFQRGLCGKCHDPHSTNNKWVLVKDSQEVCLPCHVSEGLLKHHDHPFNVKPKKALSTPLQLTDSGRLECLSCHNPHATDTEHLLRTDQEHTCLGCHPDR